MIPLEKVKQIVSTYETLEKEFASGSINKKDFAKKSKGYSSIREVINQARSYLGFEKEKKELEKIINDENSDKDMIELAKNELLELSNKTTKYEKILKIWDEIGYRNADVWYTDQTAWCMGYVCYVLKLAGYQWFQTATALHADTKSSKFGFK